MNFAQILSKIAEKRKRRREYADYSDVLTKNIFLANAKNGGTIYVIGNGPSVKNIDLKKLVDKETFVVNSFWLHPEYEKIRPKYYLVLETPNYSEAPRPLNDWEEDLPGRNPIVSSVSDTKLFFSTMAKEFIDKNNLFPQNPKFFILQQGLMDKNLNFNIDPAKPMPFTKNTIISALMLAVYMGFETIYLLGCEHDFLAYPIQNSLINYRHFYEDEKTQKPQYIPGTGSYENVMWGTLRLFQNYRYFKEKIAKSHPNVRIYNATPNSFLDVFPSINLEDVI